MSLKSSVVRVLGDPREKLLKRMPKNAVCAEVGVWKGDFSQMILDRTIPKELHLIDPWAYQTDFGERLFGGLVAQSQKDMDAIFSGVQSRFSSYPNVQYHRAYSKEAVSELHANQFDWISIDGNHYYDFVLEDLQQYAPLLKSGGLLTGDDYKWTSPELNGDLPVKRAVQDFIAKNDNARLLSTYGGQFIIEIHNT
jgi:hypothetical protein